MLLYLLISGCAGTAKGVDTSVYTKAAVTESFSNLAPESSALVIIRYPAIIHADVETLYISSFAVNSIGGDVPHTVFGKTQTARVAQSVIGKSSYFAMSLYNELKQQLPEGSVLLSPHIIVWDDERKMHSRPILATEQIPTVLTIDFNIYSYPDVTEMMESPPVTFGDLVTPLIVVKSNRWLNPALNGLLISSEPLMGAAWRQTQLQSDLHLSRRANGIAENQHASLEFIAFLGERGQNSGGIPGSTFNRGNGQATGQGRSLERYPLEKIRMDGAAVASLEETAGLDPFVSSFVKGMSRRLVSLLESVDVERATFLDRQSALARFDPELANVFFLRSGEESVRARLQLAEALIGVERKFLAAQSDNVYQGTYVGSFGAKMRKLIQSEYKVLEERRHLAKVQNMTAAVAAIVMAGTIYGVTLTTTASALTVSTLSGLALVGSTWAINKSLDSRAESEEVATFFSTRMAPAFQRQMDVQLEWLESKEVITARGFAEFRNKTLSLYQSRVRSMTVKAEQNCEFRHAAIVEAGRWYGNCTDGLAEGMGYGAISGSTGTTVEFIGEADQGYASGIGAMILRKAGQTGTIYYEGSFDHGLPDGVVIVEEAGKPRRLREFQAGRDVGKGKAAQLRRLSFASNWSNEARLQP